MINSNMFITLLKLFDKSKITSHTKIGLEDLISVNESGDVVHVCTRNMYVLGMDVYSKFDL